MAKKIAILTYTTEKGETRSNVMLAWGGISDRWRSNENYIVFDVFKDATEFNRGRSQIIESFHLPITHAQVEEMFNVVGNVGDVISNRSWELAQTTGFIEDWTAIDALGKRVKRMKNLTELGAVIVEA